VKSQKVIIAKGFAVNLLYKLIEMINLNTKLEIFVFLTQLYFLRLWLKGKNKRENPMNIKDFTDFAKDNKISSQKPNVFLFGVASILFATTGIHDVLAKPNSTILQSQMIPQQGMMNQRMMRDDKANRHFIEMMIPHHEGAVKMADLALKLAKRPEVKKLAEEIKRDQTRETSQMRQWYKQWYGTDVISSANMNTNMNNRGMMEMRNMMGMKNTMGMTNMMSVDLKSLETASDFDKAFLEEMIPHHKMALMMSNMVIDSNRPEIRKLSSVIAQSQSQEIEQMRQWQQAWYR